MSLTDDVERLSRAGVDMATMTIVFRSDGISRNEIRNAYDEVLHSGRFELVVEKGTPYYRPLDNH